MHLIFPRKEKNNVFLLLQKFINHAVSSYSWMTFSLFLSLSSSQLDNLTFPTIPCRLETYVRLYRILIS